MLLARSGFQERNTGRRGGVRAQLEGLIGREQAGSTRLPFCNQLRPLRGVERLNGVANDAGNGCKRSIFVVDREGILRYVNRAYNLNEEAQYEAVFTALRAIP